MINVINVLLGKILFDYGDNLKGIFDCFRKGEYKLKDFLLYGSGNEKMKRKENCKRKEIKSDY